MYQSMSIHAVKGSDICCRINDIFCLSTNIEDYLKTIILNQDVYKNGAGFRKNSIPGLWVSFYIMWTDGEQVPDIVNYQATNKDWVQSTFTRSSKYPCKIILNKITPGTNMIIQDVIVIPFNENGLVSTMMYYSSTGKNRTRGRVRSSYNALMKQRFHAKKTSWNRLSYHEVGSAANNLDKHPGESDIEWALRLQSLYKALDSGWSRKYKELEEQMQLQADTATMNSHMEKNMAAKYAELRHDFGSDQSIRTALIFGRKVQYAGQYYVKSKNTTAYNNLMQMVKDGEIYANTLGKNLD